MPITPDRVTRLREFGLSEYASRAYLALLDLGVAEARDVSTLSKVPQAKIYHVLEQLHEKGLAVILPEFPKKYAPIPFAEHLQRLQEEHTRAAESIAREREVLSEMFRVMGDADVGNRGFFTVIRGRRNVVTKIQEMLDEAKSDVLVLGTTGLAYRFANFQPNLEAAGSRGAKLRFIAPLTEETLPRLADLSGLAEIRARDAEAGSPGGERVAILIVDGLRAFLIHFLPDDDNLYAGKDIAVYTDQDAIVAALQSLLEPRWASAPTMAARERELLTGRLPEFTRVLETSGAAAEAFRASLARGGAELWGIDSTPTLGPSENETALAGIVREKDMTFRVILNVAEKDAADAYAALVVSCPGSEVRHLAPRLASRYGAIDDREAFFAVARAESPGAGENDLVVHTTSAGVLASLRSQFESTWTRAMPLDQRLHELENFPHVQPRELGIGRLFTDIRDACVVTDARGTIVLWNPAAESLFGRGVRDAVGRPVGDVLDDALPAFLDGAGGTQQDLVPLVAVRPDGARFEVEASLHPATASHTGARYVIALVRLATRPTRRLDVRDEERPAPSRHK
jgi:PAS domain S-box-containing protein